MSRYAYQNLNERILKLKRHLKTRRGRRDLIALGTLVDIQAELAGRLTYDKANAMLRFYYNEEAALFKDVGRRLGESPFFAFMKKEGVKYEPVSLLPETKPMYQYDDDPPIKTHAASKEYRDNYDTIDWGPDKEPKPVELEGFAVPPSIPPEVLAARDEIKRSAEACGVCGEVGHEKIEAFGGIVVTACPEVPVEQPLMVPTREQVDALFDASEDAIEAKVNMWMNAQPPPVEASFGPVEEPKHVDGCIVPQCPGCDNGEPEEIGTSK